VNQSEAIRGGTTISWPYVLKIIGDRIGNTVIQKNQQKWPLPHGAYAARSPFSSKERAASTSAFVRDGYSRRIPSREYPADDSNMGRRPRAVLGALNRSPPFRVCSRDRSTRRLAPSNRGDPPTKKAVDRRTKAAAEHEAETDAVRARTREAEDAFDWRERPTTTSNMRFSVCESSDSLRCYRGLPMTLANMRENGVRHFGRWPEPATRALLICNRPVFFVQASDI
jgi:hypothetical protein